MNAIKAAISSVPQQPELANCTIIESCHKKKHRGEKRAKKMRKCTVGTKRFLKVWFFSITSLVNNDTKLHTGQYMYLSIDTNSVRFLHIFLRTSFLDRNFRNILIYFLNTLCEISYTYSMMHFRLGQNDIQKAALKETFITLCSE